MADLVLALDGGGSKTIAAFASRDGSVELLPGAGGSNALDNPQWRLAFDAALAPARLRLSEIAYAVLGIPGYTEVAATDVLYDAAAATLGVPHNLRNDVDMAFDAAFLGEPGILALAGTGAMVVAEGADGKRSRAGGWGDAFGDEGGAFWIGREALATSTWIADGRKEGAAFLEAIKSRIGAKDGPPGHGLLAWYAALKHTRSGIAALALMVDELAEAGDPVANEIIAAAAMHLDRQMSAAARATGDATLTRWSHAGSVFRSRRFREELSRLRGLAAIPPALPPLGGGLFLAARAVGWATDTAWVERIRAGLAPLNDIGARS